MNGLMQYQPPNIVGALAQGQQQFSQQQDDQRRNALAAYVQQNGAGIMSGDKNALAGLAQYDPAAALAVQKTQAGMADDATRLDLAKRQTEAGMANDSARLDILRKQAAQQSAESAMKMDEATRAQRLDSLVRGVPMMKAATTPEMWDEMAKVAAPDLVGKFDKRDDILAVSEGLISGLGRPAPMSPEGEVAFDRSNGYDIPEGSDAPAAFQALDAQARAAGLVAGTPEYQDFMRSAGKTSVNVNTGANKYSEERGKAFAGTMGEFEAGERSARDAIGSLDVMKGAMADPGFYSGTGADSVLAIKRAAAAIGLDPNGVDSMEAFSSQSKAAALASMGGSLGTGFSNADRDFVEGQVPGLANTPEGNSKLIDIQSAIQQRKIDIAQMARDYEAKNGQIDNGFMTELSGWAEKNPLFKTDGNPNARKIGGKTSTGLDWSIE